MPSDVKKPLRPEDGLPLSDAPVTDNPIKPNVAKPNGPDDGGVTGAERSGLAATALTGDPLTGAAVGGVVNAIAGGDGGNWQAVGGAIKSGATSVYNWGKDKLSGLMNGASLPNPYDANGQLQSSESMAQNVYGKAMGGGSFVDTHAAPGIDGSGQITEQNIQAPAAIKADTINAPGVVNAQTIGTPSTLQGGQADQLRAQRLQQASDAANSPSAAAAQMRSAAGLVSQQQMGQAATARGADRLSAKRDAMLATGTQGMQAASTSASLAAQEQAQKQAALTGALSGVQSSDVASANALTNIGQANQAANLQAQTTTGQQALTAAQANQAANLQAQTTTGQQGLTAAQANQTANLQAQQNSFGNQLQGWQAYAGAKNAQDQTALQAVGAQNQAQGVAAGYGENQVSAAQKQSGSLIGAIGGAIGGVLSDERAKTDVAPQQDFLAWKPEQHEDKSGGGGLLDSVGDLLSDERAKQEKSRYPSASDRTTKHLHAAFGLADANPLATETDKHAVDGMTPEERINWAERVPTGTWRYKSGVEDSGKAPHAGTFAHALAGTGPLGKMFVDERPDGLKQVEYGPLALWVAKAALDKANKGKR